MSKGLGIAVLIGLGIGGTIVFNNYQEQEKIKIEMLRREYEEQEKIRRDKTARERIHTNFLSKKFEILNKFKDEFLAEFQKEHPFLSILTSAELDIEEDSIEKSSDCYYLFANLKLSQTILGEKGGGSETRKITLKYDLDGNFVEVVNS